MAAKFTPVAWSVSLDPTDCPYMPDAITDALNESVRYVDIIPDIGKVARYKL